jgi:hypothetical protein
VRARHGRDFTEWCGERISNAVSRKWQYRLHLVIGTVASDEVTRQVLQLKIEFLEMKLRVTIVIE